MEDVFASFYFALEDYFQEGQKPSAKYANSGSPAIYFFDPAAYNRARREMINEVCGRCKNNTNNECTAYANQKKLLNEVQELVPNVSSHANKDIMKDYFCYESIQKKQNGYVHTENLKSIFLPNIDEPECCECCNLPVAYYCSRLSPRIRAQSGQFLAFSLSVHPQLSENIKDVDGRETLFKNRLSFDYMALDEIQKHYLRKGDKRYPFLLKMVLPKDMCHELAGLLRKFGIKKIRYYPELTHLKD